MRAAWREDGGRRHRARGLNLPSWPRHRRKRNSELVRRAIDDFSDMNQTLAHRRPAATPRKSGQIVRRIDPWRKMESDQLCRDVGPRRRANTPSVRRVDYCDDDVFSENVTGDCVIALGDV